MEENDEVKEFFKRFIQYEQLACSSRFIPTQKEISFTCIERTVKTEISLMEIEWED